jgi:transposase
MEFRQVQVFIKPGTTDMRKQGKGLLNLIQKHTTEKILFSGAYYVFCGKKKDALKILYWDFEGFCVLHKKINGRFPWPKSADSPLKEEEVKMLRRLIHGKNIWLRKIDDSQQPPPKAVA